MNTESRSNVVPLFPESSDDDSSSSGWDPYIFSIVAQSDRPYGDDRRRAPRINTPTSRRALLLAKGKRKKG